MASGRQAPGRHHPGHARGLRPGPLRRASSPTRYFDVGIAEQHAVTFAAGLACEGLKPVVAIYSTFLQRAYDQMIHDVALQNLPVVFAIDRGGLVGADGPTHHGTFDLSFLTCIPNMVVMAPADEAECRRMLSTAFALDGPRRCAIRAAPASARCRRTSLDTLPLGKGEILRRGQGVALLAFGSLVRAGAGGRRRTRRHRRQHALRQAARHAI